jgi:ABC-type nitrate/sulfonate/bicarbonate transport system ATPase subunit
VIRVLDAAGDAPFCALDRQSLAALHNCLLPLRHVNPLALIFVATHSFHEAKILPQNAFN